MASLRVLRRKIKSVKSTQQITRAMKMVAAARMRRAQQSILSSRPFAAQMENMVMDLSLAEIAARPVRGASQPMHPFFTRRDSAAEGLVLVTSDKGLCGSFNANLLKACTGWLRSRQDGKAVIFVVGRKGRDFLHRIRSSNLEIVFELANIFPKAGFVHADLLGKALMDSYLERGLSSVTVIYNEFKSIAQQRVVQKALLPITPSQEIAGADDYADFLFEPERGRLLEALLPRYVKAQVYRILLESQAAELAARMNAMDSATKNAGDLLGALTLLSNRTRQASITKEIVELVSGAEALASA